MIKNIILGFLPWILYLVLSGSSLRQLDISIVAALIAFFIFSFKTLKKGFILSWGTFIYFSAMFVLIVIMKNIWVAQHSWIFANGTLALIAWLSLFIGQPFTMQYAKEHVPEDKWQSPLFIKINQLLTITWGCIFVWGLITHTLRIYYPLLPSWFYESLANGATIFGVWFTSWFPNWYRNKKLEEKKMNSAKDNIFLQGNYAPVLDELDINNLPVTGEIPKDLSGAYMRNGPNPAFPPLSYTYPFDGDGMVHAVYIDQGKAHYRNRFVETEGLLAERRAGKALYGGVMSPIMPDPKYFASGAEITPFKNGAFIHIIRHAGRYLAMHESSPAYEINAQLETLGLWVPGTNKPINVSPHTRLDPKTGELWLINYDLEPPYLTVYHIDRKGVLQQQFDIDKPHSTMLHDFVLTEQYVIFFDCPVVFDINKAMAGGEMLSWRPELGTRIGVISRQGGKVVWFETEPFFVFHFANAYEQEDDIIIDFVRHHELKFLDTGKKVPPQSLYRTKLNLVTNTCSHQQLDDQHCEFPRIKESRDSLQHRYIYVPIKTTTQEEGRTFNALMKYDVERRSSTVHDFGKLSEIGEAVFVAKKHAKSEDEGYLMLFVYDIATDSSNLAILDAQELSAQPLAQIKMPRRIPHGLHGSWMEQCTVY